VEEFLTIGVTIALLFVYFAPAIVAIRKRNRSAPGILVFNLLAGWTGLGWALALIWALKGAQA
jgi:hypothetical protein